MDVSSLPGWNRAQAALQVEVEPACSASANAATDLFVH